MTITDSRVVRRIDVYSSGEVRMHNSGRWVREQDHESLLAEAERRIAALQSRLDAVGRLSDEWLAAVRKNGVYDEFDSGLNAARTSDANELRAALGGESRGGGEVRK